MDFVKDMKKDSQPGNSVEGKADNSVNQEVDKLAGDAGVPQGADNTINEAVDSKVNDEIPGGNGN
ncbi:hypothetical protein N0V93_003186 [Gnomoniopsis smithogilvyi]|uniref:Uncharacterized protein n=1 Tax=Gnomoniopsis smithogilvyi TaxID=1191159 RepID=A0A9W8YXU3_9PEZI|nr:hypothetical protein N0V93_003186 [Gnomoniopsis smithogilvyi]